MEIQLTIANFFSKDDNDEKHVIHSKIDITENKKNDEADGVMKELFHSVIKKYHTGIEKSMRDCDFIFDCVHLL